MAAMLRLGLEIRMTMIVMVEVEGFRRSVLPRASALLRRSAVRKRGFEVERLPQVC